MLNHVRDYLLLLLSVGLIFVGGIIFMSNFLAGLGLVILGIASQIIREKMQKIIAGDGVSKISVGDLLPKTPKKGDLWVDTSSE
jgi:hypothetical protein